MRQEVLRAWNIIFSRRKHSQEELWLHMNVSLIPNSVLTLSMVLEPQFSSSEMAVPKILRYSVEDSG